jgi:hypothetical protein
MPRANSTRGGAGIIVLTACAFLAVWALIWLALTWGTGRFRASYVWMRTSAGDEAWVEFGGGRMRISPTRAGLAQAKWTDAVVIGWDRAEFPPVEAPVTPSGWEQKWDSSMLSFALAPTPTAAWRLTKSDPSGSRWGVDLRKELRGGDTLDTAPVNKIPQLGKPTLGIDARPKHDGNGSKVDIEVAMVSETRDSAPQQWHLGNSRAAWDSFSLTRDGAPLPIRVRVLDDTGDVISDKTGPIEDFGHT